MQQRDTTVEEALPGREGTVREVPSPTRMLQRPVLLSPRIYGPQLGSFPAPLHPLSLQGGSDHLLF